MAIAEIKRVLKLGGSLAIVIPSHWAKGRLKAGEQVAIVGNGELRIIPIHPTENTAEQGNAQEK